MIIMFFAAAVATQSLPSDDVTDPDVALPLYRECSLAVAAQYSLLAEQAETIALAADAECATFLQRMRRPKDTTLAQASQKALQGFKDQVRGEVVNEVLKNRLKSSRKR